MLGLRLGLKRHVAPSLRRGVRTRPQGKTSPTTSPPNIAPRRNTVPTQAAAGKDATPTAAASVRKIQKGAWVLMGLAAVFGAYTSLLVVSTARAILSEPDPKAADIAEQEDVAGRYDEIADNFDSDVNMSEWLMGLLEKRKVITKQCEGHVLEVSAGTGRNLGYYDYGKESKLKSLTLLDLSPQMIDVCKKKFLIVRKDYLRTEDKTDAPVRFVAGSALEDMPLAPNGEKYDTIIQTMGLCSTSEPVELVVNMVRHLNTHNPEARILLLEHGRSTYETWNKILDAGAKKHAEGYGCWNNRNLDDVIMHAAQRTGLEIVAKRRANFDTTYLYELKAGPTTAEKVKALDSKRQVVDVQSPGKPAVSEALPSAWTRWIIG